MSNILEQLKREGSIALWHDYQLGHANDLSGNGNDGVLVNSPWFDRNGLNTTYLGNQAVQVAHSDSINLTTFSVVALIQSKRIKQYSNVATLATKWDGGATLAWYLRFSESTGNTFTMDTVSGSSNWIASRNIVGLGCIAVNVQSGTQTPMYVDGILEDNANTVALTVNQTTASLWIGNYHALNRGFGRAISSFILFNKLLSATEHAQVYGELMKTRRRILV